MLYKQTVYYPSELILIWDEVIITMYFDELNEERSQNNTNLQVRILNLRKQSHMRDLNPEDINHLISVKGIVIRCSDIYPEMRDAVLHCA